MTDYKPIPCTRYEQFEIAIVRRQKLHLLWHEENVFYDQVVTPLTLKTRQGEEFLVFRDDAGDTRTIRLDHIRKADAISSA